jgi:Icc-related predicted phosphoesterase
MRRARQSIRWSRVAIGEWVTLAEMERSIFPPPAKPGSNLVVQARVAAIGDLHIRGPEDPNAFPGLVGIGDHADLLIVAGDLTDNGRLLEAEAVGELLASTRLPVVAVLGNHDLRSLRRVAFRRALERHGIEVLEGTDTRIRLPNGAWVGVAGTTGCGGGFWPMEGPDAIHTRTLKRLAVRAKRESAALDQALIALDSDFGIAVTHFAPTASTLGKEPLAKYWMLGNCELGIVLDRRMPDLVIHGHAHLGRPRGRTLGGIPVRNVALPVIGSVHIEILEAPLGRISVPPERNGIPQWM